MREPYSNKSLFIIEYTCSSVKKYIKTLCDRTFNFQYSIRHLLSFRSVHMLLYIQLFVNALLFDIILYPGILYCILNLQS